VTSRSLAHPCRLPQPHSPSCSRCGPPVPLSTTVAGAWAARCRPHTHVTWHRIMHVISWTRPPRQTGGVLSLFYYRNHILCHSHANTNEDVQWASGRARLALRHWPRAVSELCLAAVLTRLVLLRGNAVACTGRPKSAWLLSRSSPGLLPPRARPHRRRSLR